MPDSRQTRSMGKRLILILGVLSGVIGIPAGLITIADQGPSMLGCTSTAENERPTSAAGISRQEPTGIGTLAPNQKKGAPVQSQTVSPTMTPSLAADNDHAKELQSSDNNVTGPRKKKLAIAIKADEENTIEEMLINSLEEVEVTPDYFNAAFIETRMFDRVYNGDTEFPQESAARESVDAFLLGIIKISYANNPILDPSLVSCQLEFRYKIFDKQGLAIHADSITVVGPGFSPQAARQQAQRRLVEGTTREIMRALQ